MWHDGLWNMLSRETWEQQRNKCAWFFFTSIGMELSTTNGRPMDMFSIYSMEQSVGWVEDSHSLHCQLLRLNTW